MKKTVVYQDEINDDFSPSKGKIPTENVTESFPYEHKSILWKIGQFLAYRVLATPLVFLYSQLCCGMRVKGQKNLRKLKSGYFLYSNHTCMLLDSFFPTLISFPRRCNIITSDDAVSIHGLRNFLQMLGVVPLPTTIAAMRIYLSVLHRRISRGEGIMIYPEAHIWPYCNFVRDFKDGSLSYPVREDVPAVPAAVVYRQRQFLKKLPPLTTIVIGKPIWPDKTLSERAARRKLRNEVYDFLSDTVKRENSFEYIKYEKSIEK